MDDRKSIPGKKRKKGNRRRVEMINGYYNCINYVENSNWSGMRIYLCGFPVLGMIIVMFKRREREGLECKLTEI